MYICDRKINFSDILEMSNAQKIHLPDENMLIFRGWMLILTAMFN